MTNKIDAAAQKISDVLSKTPLFSIFTAAAAPASVAIVMTPVESPVLALPLLAVAMASPAVCGLAATFSVLNILRNHGTLSKIFSGAATAAGAGGIAGMLAYMGTPDYGPLNGYVLAAIGMTAAGALNTAAFYTRGIGRKKDENAPPPPAP